MSPATILNGKEIAKKLLARISKDVSEIHAKNKALALSTIRVGENRDALIYASAIENLFKKLNIRYVPHAFPEKVSESELIKQIVKLNADPEVTGIMLFSPLPPLLNSTSLMNAVEVSKDVEGRRVLQGSGNRVAPPTALACMALIEAVSPDLEGKEAVVVRRSDVVGKPVALLLIDKRATVTVCNSKTKNLEERVRRADILIATAGKPNLIKGAWIKPGAIVIDVGENIVDGKPVGDVEFETAKEVAGYLTPVPGGVGPVTNAMLVKNLLSLHQWKEKL